MFISSSNTDLLIYRKDEVFLEKYYFVEDIEICYSNSDEKYYVECINVFLETLKK